MPKRRKYYTPEADMHPFSKVGISHGAIRGNRTLATEDDAGSKFHARIRTAERHQNFRSIGSLWVVPARKTKAFGEADHRPVGF